MGFFKNVFGILKGEHKLGVGASNTVITSLWNCFNKLGKKGKVIFKYFAASSVSVANYMIGVDDTIKKLLDVEPNSIDIDKFQDIHYEIISGFVALYNAFDPSTASGLQKAFEVLCECAFGRIPYGIKHGEGAELDKVAFAVWDRINQITGSDQASSVTGTYQFAMIFGLSFNNAMDDIVQELKS